MIPRILVLERQEVSSQKRPPALKSGGAIPPKLEGQGTHRKKVKENKIMGLIEFIVGIITGVFGLVFGLIGAILGLVCGIVGLVLAIVVGAIFLVLAIVLIPLAIPILLLIWIF
ncbi:MAG: hypothetical protein KKD28_08760 [Chloroflexi bacterium]|nr:hypothetical protein [Chloroflexota bacterium]